jgi:hypothetical protein
MPSQLNNYVINSNSLVMSFNQHHDYNCLCHDGVVYVILDHFQSWMITISNDYVIMVIKFYNIKSNNNMQKTSND